MRFNAQPKVRGFAASLLRLLLDVIFVVSKERDETTRVHPERMEVPRAPAAFVGRASKLHKRDTVAHRPHSFA
jgi:hypothetical protein